MRLGNQGYALLNCWFQDDVEAEILYTHGTNFVTKQYIAVAFCNNMKKALGGNLGTQATIFINGRLSKRDGTAEPLVINKKVRLKIRLSEGSFEVYRDGRKKRSIRYSKRAYSSGRISIMWGGGIAGAISNMQIVGKLDIDTMTKKMRKIARVHKSQIR